MIQVPSSLLYGFLGVLELALVLAALAGFLWFRNRRQQRRLKALEGALREARSRFQVIRETVTRTPETGGDYVAQLEAQLEASRALLGDDVFRHLLPPSEDPEQARRRLLAIRHRFLELERHAQLVHEDPAAREAHWARGIEDLLVRIAPESSEPAGEDGSAAEGAAAPFSVDQVRGALEEQRGLIAELRGMLEQELAGSEQAEAVLQRLQEAERQAERIQALLNDLEDRDSGAMEGQETGALLLDLVGNQEETIRQLEALLRDSLPDTEPPALLAETIDRIQRTNRELGNCVTVLENENARLREEISELQNRVAELESTSGTPAAVEAEPGGGAAGDGASGETSRTSDSENAPQARVQPIDEVELAEEEEAAAEEDTPASSKTGTDDAALPPPRPAPSWTADL